MPRQIINLLSAAEAQVWDFWIHEKGCVERVALCETTLPLFQVLHGDSRNRLRDKLLIFSLSRKEKETSGPAEIISFFLQ